MHRYISDVNECELAIPPCGNGATCKNTEGDYECICNESWKGKDCKDGRYIKSLNHFGEDVEKSVSQNVFLVLSGF